MNKKWLISILSILIILISLSFNTLRLQTQLNSFTKSRDIKGTFQTVQSNELGSQYIVFNPETTQCYWYQQNTFYEEGKYFKLNNENIYKLEFGDVDMYFLDYDKNAILIKNEETIQLKKIANFQDFIGIDNLKNPK